MYNNTLHSISSLEESFRVPSAVSRQPSAVGRRPRYANSRLNSD
ncbi:hypothetical protein BJP36_43120 [Moorena producens JHB]|uniref:Uncharacterized protein n=1 Tax=Moorena producens (strain JHB) TaxID=1454205 RepID=A0A9Q9ST35_MOOP1|nr:hypothetical protein [Moorena producens]WAN69150.1 hypothetical protein BJP36_43120 [Moorena producens JHB]